MSASAQRKSGNDQKFFNYVCVRTYSVDLRGHMAKNNARWHLHRYTNSQHPKDTFVCGEYYWYTRQHIRRSTNHQQLGSSAKRFRILMRVYILGVNAVATDSSVSVPELTVQVIRFLRHDPGRVRTDDLVGLGRCDVHYATASLHMTRLHRFHIDASSHLAAVLLRQHSPVFILAFRSFPRYFTHFSP